MREITEESGVSRRFRNVVLLAALAVITVCNRAPAAEPTIALVVVNAAGPLAEVTEAQIRDAFMGKLRLAGGVRVHPVQLQGPARRLLLRSLLGMSEREFDLYWMRKTYEQALLPPPSWSSSQQVVDYVAREKGAIGFVDNLGFAEAPGVKIVYESGAEDTAP